MHVAVLEQIQTLFLDLEHAGGTLGGVGAVVLWKLSRLRTDGGGWHSQMLPTGEYSAPVEVRRRGAARLVIVGSCLGVFGLIVAELIELILTLTGAVPPSRWNPQPLRAFMTGAVVLTMAASPLVILVREHERYTPLEKPDGLYPPLEDLTPRGRRYRRIASFIGRMAGAMLAAGLVIQFRG